MRRYDTTCWTVVLGAAAGDAAAREVFAQQYTPVVRAYLASRWRKPSGSDEVADGVQEVLVQLFRDGGALERVDRDRPGGFRAYLYGVIRNVAINLERREHRRKDAAIGTARDALSEGGAVADDPDGLEAQDATHSDAFDRAWLRMVAGQARELLEARAAHGSPADRRLRCLRLRYEEELPPREIADRLDLEVQAVYDLLKQAKGEYRAALFEILATFNPTATDKELEAICVELTAEL